MAKLPKLSEAVNRKLELRWGDLTDSHGLTEVHLKLPDSRRANGEARARHLQAGYEQTIAENLLTRTTFLARKRFEQIAGEYLGLWASTESARTEVFVEWIGEIKAIVVFELTDLWAKSEWHTAFQRRCVATSEEALTALANAWKSRARSLEIQHLENPHLSLESLVHSEGDLGLALALDEGRKTIKQSKTTIESAQAFLNRLHDSDLATDGNSEGNGKRQGVEETSGIGNHRAQRQEAAPDPFADISGRSPLGDNPFPPGHPFHQRFEEANWDAEKELTDLKTELFRRCQTSVSTPELAKHLLTYRLARFDVIADKELRIIWDTKSARLHEDWLRDFAKFELGDILNKLGQATPSFPEGLLPYLNADGLKLILMEKVEHHNSKALAIVGEILKHDRTASKAPSIDATGFTTSEEKPQSELVIDHETASTVRKRGFEADMVEHSRIAAIVERHGGNWRHGSVIWRSNAILQLICSDFDQAEIDIPGSWLTGKTRSLDGVKLTNWSDAFTLGYKKLLVDHISYRLKMVRRSLRAASAKT